jgi:adenylate cyclase
MRRDRAREAAEGTASRAHGWTYSTLVGMNTSTPRPDWREMPREWDDNASHVAPPAVIDATSAPLKVVRTFAFLDLSGFTAFTDAAGPTAAHELLVAFRTLVRDVAGKRGVRVAKWIGDGVLLVSVVPQPVVAAAVDIASRVQDERVAVRGGVSTGPVIILDGDDYVGRALNLASRLCDSSAPGCVLADADSCGELPEWVRSTPHRPLRLKGLGRRADLSELELADGVSSPSTALIS